MDKFECTGAGFCVGLMVALLLTLAICSDDFDKLEERKAMLDACELHLPRSEKCEIIAVPESKNLSE